MKIFISADIEGVAGVSSALQGRPGNVEYENARRLMTEEASAAVRGAFKAGAETVTVADSHAFMTNILAENLDPRARLISGAPRMFSMVDGLDSSFDALILLGFHTAAGAFGTMSHTMSGTAFTKIEIDGRQVGEVELFGGYAAEMGIPLALVTGDNVLAKEVSTVFPKAKTVVVKDSLGAWATDSLSPKETRNLIETSTETCLTEGNIEPPIPLQTEAFFVEIEMTRQFFADACGLLPDIDRLSATRIRYKSQSYADATRVIQALSYIVLGVQK